jgi:hypothetical protein
MKSQKAVGGEDAPTVTKEEIAELKARLGALAESPCDQLGPFLSVQTAAGGW